MSEYKYHVTSGPILPPPDKRETPDSSVPDARDVEYWLNEMQENNWEFVGFAQKHWYGNGSFTQTFWIFRKPGQPTQETK